MDLKGKVALFPRGKATVVITDVATRKVVQQLEAQGTIGYSSSLQKNIAAIAVYKPHEGVHVIDIKSGKVLCKFILPYGEKARVALSKDAITLAVGNSTGM